MPSHARAISGATNWPFKLQLSQLPFVLYLSFIHLSPFSCDKSQRSTAAQLSYSGHSAPCRSYDETQTTNR